MGRGAYDSTDPTQAKSSAAQYAINAHRTAQAESERKAEEREAAENEAKSIRSKKSRGIMAAKRAAKQQENGGSSSTKARLSTEKEGVGQK